MVVAQRGPVEKCVWKSFQRWLIFLLSERCIVVCLAETERERKKRGERKEQAIYQRQERDTKAVIVIFGEYINICILNTGLFSKVF